ncbi:MAG TPA: NAD-glutamate dehydrogenase [Oleiagrimonas sp.]|nr:NAD-glutamate dehydrogenase [Oleiagrimonas sp.]
MALERAFDEGRFAAGVGEALEALHKQGKSSLERLPEAQNFVSSFFARTAPGDVQLHNASVWAALLSDLFEFVRQRDAGTAKVRVFNPEQEANGWHAMTTVVQVITDDSPFLVDSVSMAITERHLDTHVVIHPVLSVARDKKGVLTSLSTDKGQPESVMHFEIDRITDADERKGLEEQLMRLLADVRAAVRDWQPMRDKLLEIAEKLPSHNIPVDAVGLDEAQDFLRWVADDHFTFLGYREYEVAAVEGDEVLRAIDNSGQGILCGTERSVAPRSLRSLAASQLPQSGSVDAIILTKTNARSDIHRPGYMDYIGVLEFDDQGKPVREHRFLGLFTSSAYMRRPKDVPLLRRKFNAVMERSELRPDSYSGKALRHILETLPRDELFQSSENELFDVGCGILDLKERARARLFVRRDKYERFFSCLVFVPRDRFNTSARKRIESMLKDAFHGVHLDSNLLMGESALTRLHITIRPNPGEHPKYDLTDLEARLVNAVRDWRDDLRECLVNELDEVEGSTLANRFGESLPAGYIEEVTPEMAAIDVRVLAGLKPDDNARMSLYRPIKHPQQLRFKVYRLGGDIALSDVLPQLENLGMRVLTEHVYEMDVGGSRLSIQDLEVQPLGELAFDVADVSDHFERAFENVWRGNAESDNFNRLVLGALLDWRLVAVLRGYCKYLQQVGIAFSQSYMEETLNRYPAIANLLAELFNAKFNPVRETMSAEELEKDGKQLRRELDVLVPKATLEAHRDFIDKAVDVLARPRQEQIDHFWNAIKILLDGVASLDDERIIKSYMDIIRATTRTSHFQRFDGAPRHFISFKFDSHLVPDAPKPVPFREIWVYAPRVEGVHLRFGRVARGGLRWSDRREDFRTEVLGLVKAQMVKNTVIVPVGSKGGFFPKQLPSPAEDRDAWLEEGKDCYRMFNNGLLDITDNLVEGKLVPPENVVRHDDDDPYLVVAADKGTAKFSDIANGISADHDFWLDDAYASGGSYGYDHKGMGITAKGAWESVKRHFRALGHDSQSEDFTCVGIGDMSGDVFGNGMLLSEHIRLLAAFDHRHIFLDPHPDAARSFVERKRMFDLPRSSWEDYDTSLVSKGGGIWPRSAKSIPISAEMREVLGLRADVEHLTPMELMNAILKAPVDLLWNGGIGTYVKASSETHADAGDRANNALRVDGSELRCKVVGEGGNLGFTQKGRIEAALNGVLLNTDFIDNSAGVDTSDHEVNIKILLGDAVQRGELTFEARNKQLAAMTDEVEKLVLWDNYRQNQAITLMEHMAVKRLGTMGHFIRTLESEGRLDRQVESLPSDTEIAERKSRGQGLTRPELAILLSYDKIKLFEQLLDSDVPEDPYLSHELQRYFPEPLRALYADHMQRHRLKREIIASAVTNSTINRMGATFMLRMQEDTGQEPAAIAKAFTAAREILDARELWAAIEALDGKVAEATQLDAILQIWILLRHMTRWLLNRPGGSLDIAENVERYRPAVTTLRESMPASLTPTGQADFNLSVEKWQGLQFPQELAHRLARAPVLRAALDMAEVAHQSKQPIEHVAHVFFSLAETLDLDWLRNEIEALPVEGRWHAQARGSLLDELNHQHRELAGKVLAWSKEHKSNNPVEAWLGRDDATLNYTRSVLTEIMSQTADYPIASVALRRLAQLAQTG